MNKPTSETTEGALYRIIASAIAMTSHSSREIQEAIAYLAEDSRINPKSVYELRELLYAEDGIVRIDAAAILAKRDGPFAEDVIPVLVAVLDVYLDLRDQVESYFHVALALSALKEYGPSVQPFERSIWPYLYVIEDEFIQKLAIDVLSNIAMKSDATWMALCLMANHSNSNLREHTRMVMSSQEFRGNAMKSNKE